jgi:hypothetical protein
MSKPTEHQKREILDAVFTPLAGEPPVRHQRVVMLDDDGNLVSAGDTVRFNYGIPPVCVKAKLVQRGKQLIAMTPGHNPKECNLRSLRKYVGGWLKHNA